MPYKKPYIAIFLALLSLFIITGFASADTYDTNIFIKIDSLYHARNYHELENFALRTLQFSDSLTVHDYTVIHRFLGIIYIIQGREAEGREQFRRWLKYEPNGFLDSFNYPPYIVRIFQEIKAEVILEKPFDSTILQERWKPTRLSTIESLLVPGLGQYNKNEKKKGAILFLIQSASVAGFLVSEHNFRLADHAYHLETNITSFDKHYDEANNWNKARWASVITVVAVYIYIQTDFLIVQPSLNITDNIMLDYGDPDFYAAGNKYADLLFNLPISFRINF